MTITNARSNRARLWLLLSWLTVGATGLSHPGCGAGEGTSAPSVAEGSLASVTPVRGHATVGETDVAAIGRVAANEVVGVAQPGRGGVHQTAFQPGVGDHKFTLAFKTRGLRVCNPIWHGQHHRLERVSGIFIPEVGRPAFALTAQHIKTAIGWLQGGDLDALVLQMSQPSAVRAQLRPTGPAQRQHGGTRIDLQRRSITRTRKHQAIALPAKPTVSHVKLHRHTAGGVAQALQPSTQQRRSFHSGRKNTA